MSETLEGFFTKVGSGSGEALYRCYRVLSDATGNDPSIKRKIRRQIEGEAMRCDPSRDPYADSAQLDGCFGCSLSAPFFKLSSVSPQPDHRINGSGVD